MKKWILISVFVLFTAPVPAGADITGVGDTAITAKLVAACKLLQKQYQQGIKILKEHRIRNKKIVELKKLAVQTKKQYDFTANFSLKREMRKFQQELLGLTLLDNMAGKTPAQCYNLLLREIDLRFEGDDSEHAQRAKREMKSRLANMKRLEEIRAAKAKEASELTNTPKTTKELNASTASSTALLAALALAKEERRMEEQMRTAADHAENAAVLDNYANVISKMAEE